MKLSKWDIDTLKSVGLDHTKFNDAQLNHLLELYHAPENFHMDGEISSDEADRIWKRRLRDLGVTGRDYTKALKLIE